MKFQPGHKLAKGRPPGTKNRRTLEFVAVLEREKFCPVTAMIECYREAKKVYDSYGLIYDAIQDARIIKNDQDGSYPTPLEDKAHTYLKIAGDLAKDIASYTYPKLKSIEQTKSNPLEGMTIKEKIEAARQFLKLLESQAKDPNGSGSS